MSTSYRKINYTLRPAKNIERKMLCEAFQKLHPFGKVQSYRYVGFGSTYFSDFILYHKSLNIKRMISIEKDRINKDRFDFNLPFNCIEVMYGHSNEELPKIDWCHKSIVWLDYDGMLTREILSDIKIVISKIVSGSVIVITVNAEPETYKNNIEERLESLRLTLGEEKVPFDITANQLSGWNNARVLRRIIDNEIEQTLSDRNGVLDEQLKMIYKQIFNFHYDDGAKMLTVGGVLFDDSHSDHYGQCGFKHLEFIKDAEEPYKIEVPNLTFKEIRRLDEQLPVKEGAELQLPAVPRSDIDKYAKIYRYFPNFSETNF